jgi:uncharacterized SAM-binding protein YcdF (DUF218 family)
MKSLLLPPGSLILLLALAFAATLRWRRAGTVAAWLSLLMLVLFSLPYVSCSLLKSMEPADTVGLPSNINKAQAIVVLSANWQEHAPEYGGLTVGDMTLVRLRYAARLHRQTALPILVTGGERSDGSGQAIADHMAATLVEDFFVTPQWIERTARDTFENAAMSARILQLHGISRVAVVTNAWHVPRMLIAFERAGIQAIPAPVGFTPSSTLSLENFIPSMVGLRACYYFFHELAGQYWYRLRSDV